MSVVLYDNLLERERGIAMPLSFVHETLGQRVLLEHGAAHRNLAAEVVRLGAARAMVICAAPEAAVADRVCAGLPVALR
jgi:maleylacetate reductase